MIAPGATATPLSTTLQVPAETMDVAERETLYAADAAVPAGEVGLWSREATTSRRDVW